MAGKFLVKRRSIISPRSRRVLVVKERTECIQLDEFFTNDTEEKKEKREIKTGVRKDKEE